MIALEERIQRMIVETMLRMNGRHGIEGAENNRGDEDAAEQNGSNTPTWYFWAGRMNRLPELYKFPVSVSVKFVWDLYFFGDQSPNQRLPPFRTLEFRDFSNNNSVSYFSKARTVLNVIAILAYRNGKFEIAHRDLETVIAARTRIKRKEIDRALSEKEYACLNGIFQCGYDALLTLVYDDPGDRVAQISYSTLYKKVLSYDERRGEEEEKLVNMFSR